MIDALKWASRHPRVTACAGVVVVSVVGGVVGAVVEFGYSHARARRRAA